MRHVGTKDAAEVQEPILSLQFKQAHENWNNLKVTGTGARWSCAQGKPQVRGVLQAATSTII